MLLTRSRVLWLTFVLLALHGGYDLIHYLLAQPDSLAGFSLGSVVSYALFPLGVTIVMLSLAHRVGSRILDGLLGSQERSPENSSIALAIGVGVWGTLVLLTGLMGELNLPVQLVLAILLFIASSWKRKPTPASWPMPLGTDLQTAIFAGILLFTLWHGVLEALTPASDFDVLMAHLAIPKLYTAAQKIVPIPWLLDTHWPHLMPTFYSLALLLQREAIAALLHLAACVALIAAVFHIAKQELDTRTAWIAAALLAVQPVIARFAGTARVDGFWALFTFLAMRSVWLWKADQTPGRLAVAGVLAGMGAATKLLGVVPVGLLSVAVAIHAQGGIKGKARSAALFVCAAGVFLLPWYFKTWLEMGNPIWPFASRIFGDTQNGASLAAALRQHARMPSWEYTYFLLRYSPQALLIPLGLLLGWRILQVRSFPALPPFIKWGGWLFLPFALMVGWSYEAWRYFLPWLPFASIAIAQGVGRLLSGGRLRKSVAAGILVCAIYPMLLLREGPLLFVTLSLKSTNASGLSAREIYLRRSFPPYAFEQAVNQHLQHEFSALGRPAKILLFPDTRGYYLDAPYMWGHPTFQSVLNYNALPDGAALRTQLRLQGVTHVLVSRDQLRECPPRTIQLMHEALGPKATPDLEQETYALYRL